MRPIDADEALRMIKNSKEDNPYFNGKTTPIWETAHDCAVSCVLACPTIDPESLRKKGEWIEKEEAIPWCDDDVEVFWECSACGVPCFDRPNFCPNCGADMRGDKVG